MPARYAVTLLLVSIAATAHAAPKTKVWPLCAAQPGVGAIDLSTPLTEVRPGRDASFAEAFGRLNVKSVIRYYDHDDETKACKTLLLKETQALIKASLNVAVVFQHNNDDPATFYDGARGKHDAIRALQLADANGQPYGTTIFFGVDGVDDALVKARNTFRKLGGKLALVKSENGALVPDRSKDGRHYEWFRQNHMRLFGSNLGAIDFKTIQLPVKAYFEAVKAEFARYAAARNPPVAAYKAAAYSSGLMCEFLLDGVVDVCWLAQSTAWPGYKRFRDTGPWAMLQANPCRMSGWRFAGSRDDVEADLNQVRGSPSRIAWSTMREPVGTVGRSQKCERALQVK